MIINLSCPFSDIVSTSTQLVKFSSQRQPLAFHGILFFNNLCNQQDKYPPAFSLFGLNSIASLVIIFLI